MSRLKLFCELPNCCEDELTVEAYDMCGSLQYEGIISANEAKMIELPNCCIRLKVTNHAGLSPRSITQYFTPKCDSSMTLIFNGGCSDARIINFTLTDANYPNITPLTGGLTVMAASNVTITFTNGAATVSSMPIGTYTYVSNTIPGYSGATMPNFTISGTQTSAELKLTASGTLTVNVVDDVGTNIQSGTVQMYATDGTTALGSPVTISNGAAVFNYVPYSSSGVSFIIKQLTTDGSHVVNETPVSVTMTEQTQAIQIIDQRLSVQATFTVVDATYPGIIPAASMDGNVVVNG